MTKLENARKIINEVDEQMAKLFEQRMKAVDEVIAYKLEKNLPILDEKREQEVIERNLAHLTETRLVPYFREFLKKSMEVSRHYQQDILNHATSSDSQVEESK